MDRLEQIDLTKTVLDILNDWKIPLANQVTLLGLPSDTKTRQLTKFRSGMAFPDHPTYHKRAHYILSIQNAVDSIYPHNAQAANCWVTTDNHFFADGTPLDVMLNEDIEGMKRVVDHLSGIDHWGY